MKANITIGPRDELAGRRFTVRVLRGLDSLYCSVREYWGPSKWPETKNFMMDGILEVTAPAEAREAGIHHVGEPRKSYADKPRQKLGMAAVLYSIGELSADDLLRVNIASIEPLDD